MKSILVSLIALAVLSAGIVSFSYSRGASELKSGFVVNFTLWEHGKLTGITKRQVKQSGEFIEETTHTSGKYIVLAGTEGQGATVIDSANHKLKYIGGAFIAQQMTMDQARRNAGPYYLRDDVLLGYPVIVSQRCSEDRSFCTTFWEAPDLGDTVLRREESVKGEVHVLKEAVAVTLGQPGFTIPDYPVDKTSFEQRQKEAGK